MRVLDPWLTFANALRERVISGKGLVLVDAGGNAHASTAVIEAATLTGRRADLIVVDLSPPLKARGRRPMRATHRIDWATLLREGQLGNVATAACGPQSTWGIEESRRHLLPQYAEAVWECQSRLGEFVAAPGSAAKMGEGALDAFEATLSERGLVGPALRRFRESVPAGDPVANRFHNRLSGLRDVIASSPDAFGADSGLRAFSLVDAIRPDAIVVFVTSTDNGCTRLGLALAKAAIDVSPGDSEGAPPAFLHRPEMDAGLSNPFAVTHCAEDGSSPCAASSYPDYEDLRERHDATTRVERIGSDAVIHLADATVAVLIPEGSRRSAREGPALIVRTGPNGWFSCAIATPYAGDTDHAFARLLALVVARDALDPFAATNGHAEMPGIGAISFEAMGPGMAGMWAGQAPIYGDVRTGRMLDALVDADLVTACGSTPRAAAIHAWATHDPAKARNRSDFVRTWMALSTLGPGIASAIDSGLPTLPAVAARLGTTPSRARRMIGLRHLPKHLNRSLVDIRALDVNLMPARDDGGEWSSFVSCLDHVIKLRTRLEGAPIPEPTAFMRPMLSLGRTWRERSDALEGRSLADISDPQRSLARLIARALATAGGPEHSPDMLATAIILEHPSYAHILEISDRWHDHPVIHEFSDAGRAALPEGHSWPALFRGDVRDGDAYAEVLTTPGELHAEGLAGPDASGIEGLSHCVSGYRWACATGDSHIVGVRRAIPGGFVRLSTLEIVRAPSGPILLDGVSFRIRQHKSHANRQPSDAARAVEDLLVKGLVEGRLAVQPDALVRRDLPKGPDDTDEAVQAFHGMWRPLLPRTWARLDLGGFRARLLTTITRPATIAA